MPKPNVDAWPYEGSLGYADSPQKVIWNRKFLWATFEYGLLEEFCQFYLQEYGGVVGGELPLTKREGEFRNPAVMLTLLLNGLVTISDITQGELESIKSSFPDFEKEWDSRLGDQDPAVWAREARGKIGLKLPGE